MGNSASRNRAFFLVMASIDRVFFEISNLVYSRTHCETTSADTRPTASLLLPSLDTEFGLYVMNRRLIVCNEVRRDSK